MFKRLKTLWQLSKIIKIDNDTVYFNKIDSYLLQSILLNSSQSDLGNITASKAVINYVTTNTVDSDAVECKYINSGLGKFNLVDCTTVHASDTVIAYYTEKKD